VPVIGWLGTTPATMERNLPSFAQGLAETGYVVGRNVTMEPRVGDRGRLPALAADLGTDIVPGSVIDQLLDEGLGIKSRTYAACARAIVEDIKVRATQTKAA
jgi:hypothetical protein